MLDRPAIAHPRPTLPLALVVIPALVGAGAALLFAAGLWSGLALTGHTTVVVTAPEPAIGCKAHIAVPDAPPAAPDPEPERVWASELRAVSSQYAVGSWSADQLLGPADVYPRGEDDARAWAPLEADGGPEFVEVGFGAPRSIAAVEVYETLHPGAVRAIELVGEGGERRTVHEAAPGPRGDAAQRTTVELACTGEPVVAVRVLLDTRAVPGWNEIDAIAVRPCPAR